MNRRRDAGPAVAIEAAWNDEIRRRDEQVLAGGGGAHDADDVLAEAERRLAVRVSRRRTS